MVINKTNAVAVRIHAVFAPFNSAAGSTAAVINSQGDDRDANVLINPVTGTLVGTGLAGGLGGLTGYTLTNTPSA